jgi:hypothetical protein
MLGKERRIRQTTHLSRINGGGTNFFGGGGGETGVCPNPDFCDGSAAPTGGVGGGSNLVPEGDSATLDDSGDPSIAISYQAGVGEPPPTEPQTKKRIARKSGASKRAPIHR